MSAGSDVFHPHLLRMRASPYIDRAQGVGWRGKADSVAQKYKSTGISGHLCLFFPFSCLEIPFPPFLTSSTVHRQACPG